MPRLSDSMEEATIVRWLKADGEQVARGDELVEIETDKATVSYEAEDDGRLTIVAAEGDTVALGAVIAHVGEPTANGATPSPAAGGSANGAAQAPDPGAPVGDASRSGVGSPVGEPPPAAGAVRPAAGRVAASPLARRVAEALGVDLATVPGSGPSGRVVRADVERAAADAASAAQSGATRIGSGLPPADADFAAVSGETRISGDGAVEELTRLQRLIARRMVESRTTVPDFTVTVDVDMEQAAQARAQLRELAGDGPAPSTNDLIVKACALALRDHPRVNGSYRDDRFVLHRRVNVGIAVAADDALLVPVVADADRKGLAEIARESRALAARARDGAATPEDLDGGTFTVSNLGMLGVRTFTAVINPPQAAILAVGAEEERVVVRDGAPAVRRQMTLTLSCDHRILYGADAARFLGRVRALLEQPFGLLL